MEKQQIELDLIKNFRNSSSDDEKAVILGRLLSSLNRLDIHTALQLLEVLPSSDVNRGEIEKHISSIFDATPDLFLRSLSIHDSLLVATTSANWRNQILEQAFLKRNLMNISDLLLLSEILLDLKLNDNAKLVLRTIKQKSSNASAKQDIRTSNHVSVFIPNDFVAPTKSSSVITIRFSF